MSHTGFRLRHNGRTGSHTVGVCTDCKDDLGLSVPADDPHLSLDQWDTTKFADEPCFACGTNLSTTGDHRMSDDRRPTASLDALCAVFRHADALNVFASIGRDGIEEPEETHYLTDEHGDPIATLVEPPADADEFLHVLVDAYGDDYTKQDMWDRSERIAELLANNGLDVTFAPQDIDDKTGAWEVIGRPR